MSETSNFRQDQAALRRRQILEAATRLFAQRGYHATSIRDVHRAVGVSDGLLYHYFPSKVDLLHAVLEHGFASMRGRRLADDINPEVPVPVALRRVGRLLWNNWRRNDEFIRILLREHRVLQEAGDYSLAAEFVRSAAGLTDFIAGRIRAGEIRPTINAEAVTRTFIDAVVGHYLFAVVVGADHVIDADPEQFIETSVDLVWNGIKVETSARRRASA
jgi:AcrR family transcriptional regulator